MPVFIASAIKRACHDKLAACAPHAPAVFRRAVQALPQRDRTLYGVCRMRSSCSLGSPNAATAPHRTERLRGTLPDTQGMWSHTIHLRSCSVGQRVLRCFVHCGVMLLAAWSPRVATKPTSHIAPGLGQKLAISTKLVCCRISIWNFSEQIFGGGTCSKSQYSTGSRLLLNISSMLPRPSI
jgi:hypothetical protein